MKRCTTDNQPCIIVCRNITRTCRYKLESLLIFTWLLWGGCIFYICSSSLSLWSRVTISIKVPILVTFEALQSRKISFSFLGFGSWFKVISLNLLKFPFEVWAARTWSSSWWFLWPFPLASSLHSSWMQSALTLSNFGRSSLPLIPWVDLLVV